MNSNMTFQDLGKSFQNHPQVLNQFKSLDQSKIFITGGTGFFGCWLLESLSWAQRELGISFEVTLLSRNPGGFQKKHPKLGNLSFVKFHQGDIRTFDFPKAQYTHMIHAATEASAQLNSSQPLLMLDTIVEGTRRALDFAVKSGVSRFLLTSSGGVYGRQPPELRYISEEARIAPDPLSPGSAYGEGKRIAEHLCSVYEKHYGLPVSIARCFAFVGPYLPLDTHFAIGNFIRDAMKGGPIRIGGDGTPYRSYLYGSDLAVWLWSILLSSTSGRAYHVGSSNDVSIADLAKTVAEVIDPSIKITIAQSPVLGKPAERYVPSVERAKTELGLKETFDLRESIRRTAEWYSKDFLVGPSRHV